MKSMKVSTKKMMPPNEVGRAASRFARTLALVLGLTALTGAAPAQSTPREIIDAMAGQVLETLRDESLGTEEKRGKIEQIVYRYVDFETLSRLVLARNWRQLSDTQKSEFKEQFKKHLSATYGENIDNYRNEKVDILSERKEKRGDVTVKSKIIRGGSEDILVDYRLRRRDEAWRIIDVVIEGVSLVANFRSQFQEIITDGGVERLLKLLREKNLEPTKT
jgi:phospholipid transport system substrate-binding protein